ncbi:MAG: hypothetical protein AAB560_01415 [Patescibacteria group bacterium]
MAFYLIGLFLSWAPRVFSWGVFLTAIFFYFFPVKSAPAVEEIGTAGPKKAAYGKFLKTAIVAAIAFYVVYGLAETAAQYYVWKTNGFLEMVKGGGGDANGYFLFYSWGRFWISALLSIGGAFLFFYFLKALKKYRERFFEEGELDLGFLSALLIGWPNFVVFVPLVFLSVVIIAVFRRVFLKELYTTLGLPMLLATLLVLAFGDFLVAFFHLGVLRM